jgi:ureidoacrylate peracid hydrolase
VAGGATACQGARWHPRPKSHTLDAMVTLNARPEALTLDLDRTALVVVDMQNAFASKGGMFDLAGFDILGAAPAIEVNRRLLDAARKAGVTVVHLQMTIKPDLSNAGDATSPNYHKELGIRLMRERPELSGKLLIEDTWDWEFVDALKPAPGEHVVRKSRYNGFIRTDLDEYLRAKNVRHLLFTGIATNVCVESTARHAFFAEYWPILIEDAMNNSGPDFNRQATLWNFEHVFGWVTHSRDVLAALRARSAAAA